MPTTDETLWEPSNARLVAAECEMLGQEHGVATIEAMADRIAALTAEVESLRAALAELVACKDLKDQVDAACLYPGQVMTKERRDEAFMEYQSRKQDAWRAARAALAQGTEQGLT